MKKFLLVLLAILICMPCAYALRGAGYPAYDGTSIPENAACGTIDGQAISLEFDPSSEFSFLENGYLQACFFAFDKTQNTYLELYMLLPASITAGTTLSPQSGLEDDRSCVSVFEISGTNMTEYFAGQKNGAPYPENASYTIYIEDVQAAGSGAMIRGSLDAVLGCFAGGVPTGDALEISGLQFQFTLPFANSKDSSASGSAPAPAFTLPPDYAVI